MKLYVVMTDFGYDHKDFEGVFSTQEKAEDYVKQLNKDHRSDCAWWEDVELDKP